MLKKLLLFSVVFVCTPAFAYDTYVNGHVRKDGTYVQPHYRSNPNDNQNDNYSTKGNTNPYTGERGYHKPDNDNVTYELPQVPQYGNSNEPRNENPYNNSHKKGLFDE